MRYKANEARRRPCCMDQWEGCIHPYPVRRHAMRTDLRKSDGLLDFDLSGADPALPPPGRWPDSTGQHQGSLALEAHQKPGITVSHDEFQEQGVPARVVSVPKPAISWPRMVLEAAALLSILLCLGLAVLWLVRHPNLTDFDEVGHIDNALSDAVILRTGNAGILRDALFLWNRWQPPGLRLVGLPIAVVFWPVAPEALRLASGAMFLLTALVLWLALRRLAGRAGAAAGVLLYAVSPVNLFGAQNFMTESVLHLSAALTLCLLVAEAQASRASIPRMALLGLVMGLGMLTKLTFLPTLGIIWLGVAVHGWWRDRNAADLGVRLLLPAIGMLLLAWPHYALNGSRFLVNLRLAAAGLGVEIWPETGLELPPGPRERWSPVSSASAARSCFCLASRCCSLPGGG